MPNRKCPLNGKDTLPIKPKYNFDCHDTECRFQHDGKCVLIANFYETRLLSDNLFRLARALGINLRS